MYTIYSYSNSGCSVVYHLQNLPATTTMSSKSFEIVRSVVAAVSNDFSRFFAMMISIAVELLIHCNVIA